MMLWHLLGRSHFTCQHCWLCVGQEQWMTDCAKVAGRLIVLYR